VKQPSKNALKDPTTYTMWGRWRIFICILSSLSFGAAPPVRAENECPPLPGCSSIKDTCKESKSADNGNSLVFRRICMKCSDGDMSKTQLRWMPLATETKIFASVCGRKTVVREERDEFSYETDWRGQCLLNESTKTETLTTEEPKVEVKCPASSRSSSPSSESSSSSSPSTVLACTEIKMTTVTTTKSGYVHKPGKPSFIPPGGSNAYVGVKTTIDTLAESRDCPNPYRKRGRPSCSLGGDWKLVNLTCG
jgi:hypothetical protein